MAATESIVRDGKSADADKPLRQSRALVRRALSEPLLHFGVAGALLFAAGDIYQRATTDQRIVITTAHVEQLANAYAPQYGTQPDAQTLDTLIKRDIDDEILFRQGLALKLDQGDEIVRRRVIQKMQFLMQDLSAPREPTDAQLRAYLSTHAAHYATPPRATFTHIYFSSDKGGDGKARARAIALLGALPSGITRAPDRGDPFPDLYDFSAFEPQQVERLFGHTPFADAVFAAPTGRWAGPYWSGYGWHVIYVSSRTASAPRSFDSVRSAVREDYLQDAQDAANKQAFKSLAHRFTVVREDRKSLP